MSKRAAAGSVIEGKYRLERELGAGGMGSVWLATQLMVDRSVAIKLLHPSFVDSADLQARFEVEAKAIGRLNHPNVITLYDFGFSEELRAFYTVIEYIDGESLDKKLNRRLPLAEVRQIVRQIALALDHAHHFRILHRDLKPENVMLARMTDGTEMVKVLDFGIARIVKGTAEEAAEAQRITKAGEVFGTPAYMSPEQARSVRSLTPAADLYSLGVMFYELVAGKLPFFANSAFDLLMMHVTKPVPPFERTDVPDELEALIQQLLDKDTAKRVQSGRELVAALDALHLPTTNAATIHDEFDAGPTVLQKTPTPTIGTPPPGLLSEIAVPLATMDEPEDTVADDAPAEDAAASTVRLNATTTGVTDEPQIERPQRKAIIAVAAFLFLGGLFGIWMLSAGSSESEARAAEEPTVTAPISAPAAAPHIDSPAKGDIATALEIAQPLENVAIAEEERPSPLPEQSEKPSNGDAVGEGAKDSADEAPATEAVVEKPPKKQRRRRRPRRSPGRLAPPARRRPGPGRRSRVSPRCSG